MRILIVTQYFWPEDFRVNEVASDLVARGFEVDILTGKPNYPNGRFFDGYGIFNKSKERYQGTRVWRVPLVPRGKGGAMQLALNYISFVFFACLIGPWICNKKYDAIFVVQLSPITVAIPAILLKKLIKAPMYLWILDLWPESLGAAGGIKSNFIINYVGKLARWIYGHSDKILISSQGFNHSIMKYGAQEEKIVYFPNWSDDVRNPAANNNEYDMPLPVQLPAGFIVMFTGNIGVAQDFETVLNAAEELKKHQDIHWVILGNGRRFDWLNQQVKTRKLETCVHVLGRYPIETMPSFYQHADTLLAILKKEPIFEYTVPGKIQSYMASGKPIIAALEGEGARLIDKSLAGISCSSQNSALLANSVLRMYQMSENERIQMGLNGYQYFKQNFERKNLISELEQLFLAAKAA